MYQHPKNPQDSSSGLECVIGDNTSPGANEVLKIMMLFLNFAVVQPCADIVQPSMTSIEDVIQASLVNRSLLHEMVHALATKQLLMPSPEERAGEGVQSFFAQALEGHGANDALWDALTRFKLASSRHFLRRKKFQVLKDDLDYGHKFSKYGLHLLQYDNLPRAEDYLPLPGDFQDVHARSRGYITMMLKAAPHLPTVMELEELQADYMEGLEAELEVELDPNEREDADDQYAANYVKSDNVLFRDLNCSDTVLSICGHVMDLVQTSASAGAPLDVQRDRDLQDALFAASLRIDADGSLIDEHDYKISPIHLHTGALTIGDGSPSYTILRGIDQGTIPRHVPGEPDQPAVYNLPGGFHMYLEMWKMWGGLFRDSHLTTIVKTWRPTPGKLDWFLNPGDPRQTEDKTEEYILAHYLTAARACAAALGPLGEEQVTPHLVEDYMLKRACEHAAVFDVYLGLQWANVMFMMRDSEGSGDCGNLELFQRAQ
ncbi:hypothetical protein B484DRAFT_406714, partial [Ochromonadaceae sp. CCMP2298]